MHICLNTLNSLTFGLFRGYLYLPIMNSVMLSSYRNLKRKVLRAWGYLTLTKDERNYLRYKKEKKIFIGSDEEVTKQVVHYLQRFQLSHLSFCEFLAVGNRCAQKLQWGRRILFLQACPDHQ